MSNSSQYTSSASELSIAEASAACEASREAQLLQPGFIGMELGGTRLAMPEPLGEEHWSWQTPWLQA